MNNEELNGIITILSLTEYFFNSVNSILKVIKIEDMVNAVELESYYLKSQRNYNLIYDFNFYYRLN